MYETGRITLAREQAADALIFPQVALTLQATWDSDLLKIRMFRSNYYTSKSNMNHICLLGFSPSNATLVPSDTF